MCWTHAGRGPLICEHHSICDKVKHSKVRHARAPAANIDIRAQTPPTLRNLTRCCQRRSPEPNVVTYV